MNSVIFHKKDKEGFYPNMFEVCVCKSASPKLVLL
jgi:hypothetical protein